MPRSLSSAAASPAAESEWEVFCRLLTHDDRDSYYVVSSNVGGSWNETAVRKESLPAIGFNSNAAYYMTHNGFTSSCRKADQVRQLNSLFFDLDCHDRDTACTRTIVACAVRELERAVRSCQLPEPTMVIDSGRGLQLFYVLRRSIPFRCQAGGQPNTKAIKLFEGVQKQLADILDRIMKPVDGISVDRATFDASRVSRIPGTFNAKAGCFASIVSYSDDALHSLSDLASFTSKSTASRVMGNKLKRSFVKRGAVMRFQPLMMSRLGKVMELQRHRGFDCSGTRELMSFVFYNTAVQIYDRTEAAARLKAFNARFITPLVQSELDGVVKSVDTVTNVRGEKGYYLIGAKRLCELLALTNEEIVAINFFESKRSIERAEAKRNTKLKRERRNNLIMKLHAAGGYTYAKIADAAKCSIRTVASVIKNIKANKNRGKAYNNFYCTRYNKNVIKTCNFLSYEFKECSACASYTLPVASLEGSHSCMQSSSMTKTLPSSVLVTLQEGFLYIVRYLLFNRLVQ